MTPAPIMFYGVDLFAQLRRHIRQYRTCPPHTKAVQMDCIEMTKRHIRWRKAGWLGERDHG